MGIYRLNESGANVSQIDPKSLPEAPRAPKHVHEEIWHGEVLCDDYFWLRDKASPEVEATLNAENEYFEAAFAPLRPLEARIFKEISGRINQTDLQVPVRDGDYFYYHRTEEGKQYPIHCRKQAIPDGAEEVILDLNLLAEGLPFCDLGRFQVSHDGALLAYTLDSTGFREFDLHVKDLRTGEILPFQRAKVRSVAWSTDNQTLFFTRDDDAKRSHQLYRHRLGALTDDLLYEEKDQRFGVTVATTRDKQYVLLTVASHTTSEIHCLPANQPRDDFWLLLPRTQDIEYEVAHHGDHFYLLINDTGRNFRVVTFPDEDMARDRWAEIIPHRADRMLETIDLFAHHMVVTEREGGFRQLRIVDLADGSSRRIPVPEAVFTIRGAQNPTFDTACFRYNYQSPLTPPSVYEYDLNTGQSTLLKQTEVLGDFDPSHYKTELLWATSTDGTRIPVSLVYKTPLKADGARAGFLTGYGAYGYPLPTHFSHARLSLMERGLVVATAHVRGGGELGKVWHDQGRMFHKKNSFLDFIAAADHLVQHGVIARDRLAISGGSAGGLLMGAVTNLRPDLARAVVMEVPFVDVINTMLDETLPLTVGEFEEWGNPKEEATFHYIRSYCPYANLEAKDYPHILILTSLNDSQVMYWEPAKFVARLRTLKTNDTLLLFHINMEGGHGGASGRYDRWRETARTYAFVLDQVGLEH